jgi:hypothetical protein
LNLQTKQDKKKSETKQVLNSLFDLGAHPDILPTYKVPQLFNALQVWGYFDGFRANGKIVPLPCLDIDVNGNITAMIVENRSDVIDYVRGYPGDIK